MQALVATYECGNIPAGPVVFKHEDPLIAQPKHNSDSLEYKTKNDPGYPVGTCFLTLCEGYGECEKREPDKEAKPTELHAEGIHFDFGSVQADQHENCDP